MATEQNLRPFSTVSREEHLAASRKGGIASGESRRRRRTFKELIQIALELEDTNGQTNAEAIVATAIEQAKAGDDKARSFIRDTLGEKPTDTIDVNTREKVPEGLPAIYAAMHRDYEDLKARGDEP